MLKKITEEKSIERPTCVSLFTGAAGLDLGLEAAGFHVRFASDIDPAAVATIRANRPFEYLFEGDVRDLDGELISNAIGGRKVDLLAGGPPCQSFSTAGRRLSVKDENNGPLVFQFVRLVQELQPTAFIMENVKGILSAPLRWRALPYNNNGKRIDEQYGALLNALLERFRSLGYGASVWELNAADYGVAQSRHRVFIVGFQDGTESACPVQTHAKRGNLLCQPWRTIRDAWQNLPTEETY